MLKSIVILLISASGVYPFFKSNAMFVLTVLTFVVAVMLIVAGFL